MKRVVYGDVAVGAREDFKVSSDIEELDGVSKKEQILQNLTFGNYSNPIEKYSVILDNENIPIPRNTEDLNLGYWSEQVSNENGDFSVPIVITLQAKDTYSSQGITFEFDNFDNIYPTNILIEWYEKEVKLSSKKFEPDNSIFFCENIVQEYDKLQVTFYSMNMPYNRLRIHSIAFGKTISFDANELLNVSVAHKIDISGITIPIGTANIRLRTDRADSLNFSEQQPISIELNGSLEKLVYIKSAKRTSITDFNITAEDASSILDGVEFLGGIYDNEIAYDLYEEIFKTANVDYDIDESFKNVTVSGHLPISSCREAIQQMSFATNGVIINSNKNKICVVPYETIVNSQSNNITLGRQKKQSLDEEKAVTSIEISSHTYSEGGKEKIIFEDKGDTIYTEGDIVSVRTDLPCYGYKATINETKANEKIVDEHPNYVKFKYSSGIKITAKEYNHIEKNHYAVLNQRHIERNVKKISTATLVGENNIDKVLEKCYNYYSRNKKANSTIIDIEPLNVGDRICVDMQYYKAIDGIITSQSYSIIGNTLVKNNEIVGDYIKPREVIKYGEGVYGELIYGTLK